MNASTIKVISEGQFEVIRVAPCDDQVITRLPKEMKQALTEKAREKNTSISELTRAFYVQLLNS